MGDVICHLSGKIVYLSKAEAKRAAKWANMRRMAGRRMEPYWCRDGGHWHLTSKGLHR